MNDEKEKKSEEELERELKNIIKEIAGEHNRNELRKIARLLAIAGYVLPEKKFTLVGKYTVIPEPQKKMKVMIVIAEPEKFDEELHKVMKYSANMEYHPPEKHDKDVKGVRIHID